MPYLNIKFFSILLYASLLHIYDVTEVIQAVEDTHC